MHLHKKPISHNSVCGVFYLHTEFKTNMHTHMYQHFFSNHIQNFHYTCSISFQNTSGCMIQSLFTILSVFITNNDVIIIFKMSWQFHNKAKYLASPANAFTLHKNQQS